MTRLLIFAILIFGMTACGHDHETENKATIALSEIKPTESTALINGEAAVAVGDVVVAVEEETTEEVEEVTEVEGVKKVEKEKVIVPVKEVKKERKKSSKKPVIKFEKTTHYFGLINEGETITTKFWFDNVGDAPLLIKDASATCGCTYPGYPFVPIKPGERSSINVSFNSKGKFGKQKPVVTVQTNASSKPIKLYLEGEVKTEVAEETATEQ